MLKFSLDTSCLIDVDDDRCSAPFVKKLLAAAKQEIADVAMVASSASERQRGNEYLDSIEIFNQRRKNLGFGDLELLAPILRWGIGFWDTGVWADDQSVAREALIYRTMFRTSKYEWADFAVDRGANPSDQTTSAYFKWRNQILDAQAFWAHEFHDRDIFVTSNLSDFGRLVGDPNFPDAKVLRPTEAADLI